MKQLVDEFARQGHKCVVIAPFKMFRKDKDYVYKEEQHIGCNTVIIYRPKYFSVSDIKVFGRHVSTVIKEHAICKVLKEMDFMPDVVYGHFWPSAIAGYKYAKSNHIPLFVATGESDIQMIFQDIKYAGQFCGNVEGVVCVSTKNKTESIELGLTTEEKCKVFPNAIDNKLFFKRDKIEVRKQLGLPLDKFITVFVGTFKSSKGPDRVSEAIDSIQEQDVYSVFIGDGILMPSCKNMLFCGRLQHSQIPQYLNAADVFVLPTLAEGCCNAIIEAMACGLPIISSNMPFNWDVLNDSNSILIDPLNTKQIAEAIKKLRDDKALRESLSQGALKTAAFLTIDKRANNIVEFLMSPPRC